MFSMLWNLLLFLWLWRRLIFLVDRAEKVFIYVFLVDGVFMFVMIFKVISREFCVINWIGFELKCYS